MPNSQPLVLIVVRALSSDKFILIKLSLFGWNLCPIKYARRSIVSTWIFCFEILLRLLEVNAKWVNILAICMCVLQVKKKCIAAAAAMGRRRNQHHYRHYEIYATHSNEPRVERRNLVWLPVQRKMIPMNRDRQKSRVSTVQSIVSIVPVLINLIVQCESSYAYSDYLEHRRYLVKQLNKGPNVIRRWIHQVIVLCVAFDSLATLDNTYQNRQSFPHHRATSRAGAFRYCHRRKRRRYVFRNDTAALKWKHLLRTVSRENRYSLESYFLLVVETWRWSLLVAVFFRIVHKRE